MKAKTKRSALTWQLGPATFAAGSLAAACHLFFGDISVAHGLAVYAFGSFLGNMWLFISWKQKLAEDIKEANDSIKDELDYYTKISSVVESAVKRAMSHD